MDGLTSIRSSYVRYKESTQKLVRWLVTTVSTVAEPTDDGASTLEAAAKARRKGGKGKRSKKGPEVSGRPTGEPVISIRNFIDYSKLIAEQAEKHKIPEGVFSLFESVIQARRMVASFYRQLDTSPDVEAKNESHLNFIRVLEEAFEILGGSKWREEIAATRAARKTQSSHVPNNAEDGSALHMSNRFAELEVEDQDLGYEEAEDEAPTKAEAGNEWISGLVPKPGSSKSSKKVKPKKFSLASYKISEDLSEGEELSFAVWCFFVDMNSIRQYLKAVWNQVRKDNIDLVTASVVSSTAVRMVGQLEAALQLSFPRLKEYPDLLRALLTELPVQKVKRLLDLLDFCLFFPVHSLCAYRHRLFKEMPEMSSCNMKEISDLADSCGLNGRVVHTSIAQAEKISDEATFLGQYLFKLMICTEYADRSKPRGEPRLGMSAFHMDFENFVHMGALKTRLVFSVQLLVDIHNAIVVKSRTKYQFPMTYKFVKSQQVRLGREISIINELNGPAGTKRTFSMFIKWCDNWIVFGKCEPKIGKEEVAFPKLKTHLLSDNPWHLGLVYAEVSSQLFSMASYHSALSLPSMLHLYNFLLHVNSLVPEIENLKPIPILELLCEAFVQHVFQGSRPTQNFATRFVITSRKELSPFASDAHRRNKNSAPTPKQLERLALPAVMTTQHSVIENSYQLSGETYTWIEKALQPTQPSAAGSSQNTKKGKGKQSSILASLSPAQLLDKLCETLWQENNGAMPLGRVDMLRIREVSLEVKAAVYQKVRRDFVSSWGQRYPDRISDEEAIDMTPSILDIERHSHHKEAQKRIIRGTKEVFEGIFRGKSIEKYFAKMPMARKKGWRAWEKEVLGEKVGPENGDGASSPMPPLVPS
ncbi:hypothetical protein DFH27DRAFT_255609 [Peziza echinospora]|nr:hypothetical protein DFH27DRAFT_255609 [Peziza echinospora]